MRFRTFASMARGEGFGLIVGQGVRKMKQISRKSMEPIQTFYRYRNGSQGLEYSQYLSKESLVNKVVILLL